MKSENHSHINLYIFCAFCLAVWRIPIAGIVVSGLVILYYRKNYDPVTWVSIYLLVMTAAASLYTILFFVAMLNLSRL